MCDISMMYLWHTCYVCMVYAWRTMHYCEEDWYQKKHSRYITHKNDTPQQRNMLVALLWRIILTCDIPTALLLVHVFFVLEVKIYSKPMPSHCVSSYDCTTYLLHFFRLHYMPAALHSISRPTYGESKLI